MSATPASDSVIPGPAAAGSGFCVQRLDYAPGHRLAPHAHDRIGITLVVDGLLREVAHGTEEDASALSVVVKPAGTMHGNEVGPRGARTIRVEIVDEALLLEDAHRLGPWRWMHAGPGVQPLLAIGRALLDPASGTALDEMVLELLGEVANAPTPRSGDAPVWIRRAREALDDLGLRGIEVRDLAARLRVHPVSLTRAFRRAYGVPVTTYRRRVRLRRAAEQIAGTDRTMCSIAHAAGYSDQSHMCREVQATTGLTPSGLRAAARA